MSNFSENKLEGASKHFIALSSKKELKDRVEYSIALLAILATAYYLILSPLSSMEILDFSSVIIYNLWGAILGGWFLSSIFFIIFIGIAGLVSTSLIENRCLWNKLLDFCYKPAVIFFAMSILTSILVCAFIILSPLDFSFLLSSDSLKELWQNHWGSIILVISFGILLPIFLPALAIVLLTLTYYESSEYRIFATFCSLLSYLIFICSLSSLNTIIIKKLSKKVRILTQVIFILLISLSILFLFNPVGYHIVRYLGIANPQITLDKDVYVLSEDKFVSIHITALSLSTPTPDGPLFINLTSDNGLNLTLYSNQTGGYSDFNLSNLTNSNFLAVYYPKETGLYNIYVASGRLQLTAEKRFLVINSSTTTTSTTTSTSSSVTTSSTTTNPPTT